MEKASATIGNLNLSFFEREDNVLTIEAENKKISKFYQKQLNCDQLSKLTMNLVSNPQEFIENFKHSLKDEDSNVKFAVINDATLTIDVNITLGNRDVIKHFEIELDELNMKPLEICEIYLHQLPTLKEGPLPPVEETMTKMLHFLCEHTSKVQKELDEIKGELERLEKK